MRCKNRDGGGGAAAVGAVVQAPMWYVPLFTKWKFLYGNKNNYVFTDP